jgi:hypothetical protein
LKPKKKIPKSQCSGTLPAQNAIVTARESVKASATVASSLTEENADTKVVFLTPAVFFFQFYLLFVGISRFLSGSCT